MLDEEPNWQLFGGRPGWPTVTMAAFVITSYIAVFWVVLTEQLPLWAGMAANIPLAYLAFTPMQKIPEALKNKNL